MMVPGAISWTSRGRLASSISNSPTFAFSLPDQVARFTMAAVTPRPQRRLRIVAVLKTGKKRRPGPGHRHAGDGSPQPLDRLVKRGKQPPARRLQVIAEHLRPPLRPIFLPPPLWGRVGVGVC